MELSHLNDGFNSSVFFDQQDYSIPVLMTDEVNDNTSMNMDTTTSQKCTDGKRKSKKNGGCICPICMEIKEESTKYKAGHDAI